MFWRGIFRKAATWVLTNSKGNWRGLIRPAVSRLEDMLWFYLSRLACLSPKPSLPGTFNHQESGAWCSMSNRPPDWYLQFRGLAS